MYREGVVCDAGERWGVLLRVCDGLGPGGERTRWNIAPGCIVRDPGPDAEGTCSTSPSGPSGNKPNPNPPWRDLGMHTSVPIRTIPQLLLPPHRITPPPSQSLCATNPATTPSFVFTPPSSLSFPLLVSCRAHTALRVASPKGQIPFAHHDLRQPRFKVSSYDAEGTPQSHVSTCTPRRANHDGTGQRWRRRREKSLAGSSAVRRNYMVQPCGDGAWMLGQCRGTRG
ncbi:hypothetical protein FIBSPDRAFT_130998 [Athelia psychrophila]|uniref:Uncharacterized protein n=1 Tax=Athelia psychrophila TaxID=1759441 RepID=A0A166CCH6_9AGAM|nr:hypothetical protein FIBSPDRAFT_130998 [Fibularhizoctonia sp. CBS 109695]